MGGTENVKHCCVHACGSLGIPTWLIEALQLSLILCEVGETQPRCPTKVPDKENEVVMVTGEWKGRK